MLGMDKVFEDLDSIRRRVVRLREMDRLSEEDCVDLLSDVLRLKTKAEKLALKEAEQTNGNVLIDIQERESHPVGMAERPAIRVSGGR